MPAALSASIATISPGIIMGDGQVKVGVMMVHFQRSGGNDMRATKLLVLFLLLSSKVFAMESMTLSLAGYFFAETVHFLFLTTLRKNLTLGLCPSCVCAVPALRSQSFRRNGTSPVAFESGSDRLVSSTLRPIGPEGFFIVQPEGSYT